MKKKEITPFKLTRIIIFSAVLFVLVIAFLFFSFFVIGEKLFIRHGIESGNKNFQKDFTQKAASKIEKFKSDAEFKDYLIRAQTANRSKKGFSSSLSLLQGEAPAEMKAESMPASAPADSNLGISPESDANINRFSQTNVQVAGIDEPDIAKTDGVNIYYALPSYEIVPLMEPMNSQTYPIPSRNEGKIEIIKAFPYESSEKLSELSRTGELLIYERNLIVLPKQGHYYPGSRREIESFSLDEIKNPPKVWELKINDRDELLAARLYQGKIFIVTRSQVSIKKACPIEPIIGDGVPKIACNDIYRLDDPQGGGDSVYSLIAINAKTGKVERNISFLGSNQFGNTTVYMSPENFYVAYFQNADPVPILLDFFRSNKDIFPSWAISKLEQISSYEIGMNAKNAEIDDLFAKIFSAYDRDEELKLRNEVTNRFEGFAKNRLRDFGFSTIAKFSIKEGVLKATGTVPGKLLNQWSLDEYAANLRVATTSDPSMFFFGGFSSLGSTQSSVNDVYVLNENLKEIGKVEGLGLGERIYAVRFIKERGFVVTYKQMDPLYVIDLSSPKAPKKAGELKIPGYSSYLHPIKENKLVGIGEENQKVKVAVFDVTDAQNPLEIANYKLDDYYSEVQQNHHAFLADPKHEIFFLPATKGGYVFSFKGDALKLQKAVEVQQVQRAVYINDLFYILGESSMKIYSMADWQELKEINLK